MLRIQHLCHFKLPESTEFKSVGYGAVLLGKLLMTFKAFLWNFRTKSSIIIASLPRSLESSRQCCKNFKSHFVRIHFSSTRKRVSEMSYVASESHLYTELQTSIRTERFLGHFLIILKHHIKRLNLLFSWNWSTYTAVMDFGLNSSNAMCLTSLPA
jgi:hypothetical protein